MIRPLTIITFLMACGSGLYLYQTKHDAQVLDRDIERAVRDTGALREQSRLLAAEWTMLNDPETLRTFSDQYLALKSIAPTQFTSMADLNNRLPSIQIITPPATPADTTDQDDAAVMSSDDAESRQVPGAAPSPAAVPATPAVVATREAKPSVAASSSQTVSAQVSSSQASSSQAASAQASSGQSASSPASATIAAAKPSVERTAERPVERPAERKVVALARPLASPSSSMRGPEQRQADSRPMERLPEQRQSEQRAPEQQRLAAVSSSPVTRPTVVAASVPARPAAPTGYVPAAASVAPPIQAQAPAPYSGSLLGMARTGVSPAPVPRPVPVSASQWSN